MYLIIGPFGEGCYLWHLCGKVTDWQGVEVKQAIVYAALTGLALHDEVASKCNSNVSKTCNPWMGATMTLNMVPDVVDDEKSAFGRGQQLQLPLITPEQMTLAMHKLFGVAATEMMGQGPGNRTSEGGLYGLDPANDLVPGRVPYFFVLGLLVVSAAFTVIAQLWALSWDRHGGRLRPVPARRRVARRSSRAFERQSR